MYKYWLDDESCQLLTGFRSLQQTDVHVHLCISMKASKYLVSKVI